MSKGYRSASSTSELQELRKENAALREALAQNHLFLVALVLRDGRVRFSEQELTRVRNVPHTIKQRRDLPSKSIILETVPK